MYSLTLSFPEKKKSWILMKFQRVIGNGKKSICKKTDFLYLPWEPRYDHVSVLTFGIQQAFRPRHLGDVWYGMKWKKHLIKTHFFISGASTSKLGRSCPGRSSSDQLWTSFLVSLRLELLHWFAHQPRCDSPPPPRCLDLHAHLGCHQGHPHGPNVI